MIYNQIFTELKSALLQRFSDITLKQEYQPEETGFPLVTFEEYNAFPDNLDNGAEMFATARTYQTNIFTCGEGKKYKARQIAEFIMDFLYQRNVVCRFSKPVPNVADNTIYRIRQNYSVGVTKNNEFYRA